MSLQEPPIAAFGLDEASISDSGELELNNLEDLHQIFPEVALVLGDHTDKGFGKLAITNRRVVWIRGQQPKVALAAQFQAIVLHALAQADEVYSKPCIYMQIEPSSPEEADDNEEEEAESVANISPELRLVPRDSEKLQEIFQVMCECAALNPDESMADEDGEEGDEGFFYDEEAALEGAAAADGRGQMLDHLDSLLQMPRADQLDDLLAEDPGRFADADEEQEEAKGGHPNGLPKAS